MAGEGFGVGQALGASLASTVTQGVAQWRQIQLERQQQKEFEGGIALYNQRAMTSRQALNPEPQKLLNAYQQQWQRYPQSEVEERPTGEIGDDGQAVLEPVVRTPEGDIPLNQLAQLKATKMQGEIQLTMADFDALMELQARYPNNPKIQQFVASTAATINQKWQLKFKAQEQQGLEMARQLAAQQFQQEQALKQQQFQLERQKFEEAPERARQQTLTETDERIRGDQARIEAQKQADIEVEGVKAQNKPERPATEFVKKLQQMAPRAQAALEELDKLDVDRAGLAQGAQTLLPNALRGSERQQIDQAAGQFVNSILRAESGATITESEIEKAKRQYIPQVGDSPEVIQQKRQARATAVQELYRAAELEPPAAGGGGGLSQQEQALIEAVRAGQMSKEEARAKRAALRGQ